MILEQHAKDLFGIHGTDDDKKLTEGEVKERRSCRAGQGRRAIHKHMEDAEKLAGVEMQDA